jgi:hypothetical protein
MPLTSQEAQDLFAKIQQRVTDDCFEEIERFISDRTTPLTPPDKMVQGELKPVTSLITWDSTKIKWEPANGPKGPYEKSVDTANPEYQQALKIIQNNNRPTRHKENDGKINVYWAFREGVAIGRKPALKVVMP